MRVIVPRHLRGRKQAERAVAREMRASVRDVSIICREFGKPIKSSFNGSRCLLTLQPS
jgi:hypothetical protein